MRLAWHLTKLFIAIFLTLSPARAGNVSYGMNFQPETYYSADAIYVDLCVHASAWGPTSGSPTGYVVPLTANGYPASGSAYTIISPSGYQNGICNFYGKGRFTLSCSGPLSIVPNTLVTQDNITTCQMTINNAAPSYPAAIHWSLLTVTNIDPNNPPDEFHIIAPGYGTWPNVTATFTKEFTNGFGMFSTIRGWGMYGYSGPPWAPVFEQNWADRPNPNYWSTAQRSYENFVAYCNATHSDMWINIPIEATDDWCTGMAQLIKNNLDPSLHVYVEPADECWNYAYPQWGIVEAWDQTNASLDTNAAWYRHGEEVAYLLMHYRSVMQPVLGTQARFVLAGQLAGAAWTVGAGLKWVAKNYGDASPIYAIAGAPYMSPSSASPYSDLDTLFVSMNDYTNANLIPWLTQYSALAKQYNVKLFCYEAGQGLVPKSDMSDANLLLSAQLDPRMGTAHYALATALENAGVDLCMLNDDCDSWAGNYGYWGLITDIREVGNNPPAKYTACVNLALSGPGRSSGAPSGGNNSGNGSGGTNGGGAGGGYWNKHPIGYHNHGGMLPHHGMRPGKLKSPWLNGHPFRTMPQKTNGQSN